jgi:hypothetical protein
MQATPKVLIHRDTKAWNLQVWVSFGISIFLCAVGLTAWGLLHMDVNDTYKAFLGVSWLYLITCIFTLAKTLRDRHEANLKEASIQGRTAHPAEAAE